MRVLADNYTEVGKYYTFSPLSLVLSLMKKLACCFHRCQLPLTLAIISFEHHATTRTIIVLMEFFFFCAFCSHRNRSSFRLQKGLRKGFVCGYETCVFILILYNDAEQNVLPIVRHKQQYGWIFSFTHFACIIRDHHVALLELRHFYVVKN